MLLQKGINLGGFLSQCNHKKEHYDTFILESDIESIAKMGFDHVRLPIDYLVFEKDNGDVIEEGFERVNNVILWSQKNHLDIILDLHKAYGYDFNDAGNKEKNNLFSNKDLQDRFVKLWVEIATRYSKYPNVAFELLNEVVENDNAERWNELIDRTVSAIRKITKEAIIIYGGIQWNSAKTVKFLRKPQDKNIMFTFHFYEPLVFTHQNAYWVPEIKNIGVVNYPDTMDYYKEKSSLLPMQGANVVESKVEGNMGTLYLTSMIQEAIDAAKKVNVTLYCGEFGVIDQAPVSDTLRWVKDVMKLFRQYHIGYALWTYKQMDFGILEDHYSDIREEMIKELTK